MKKRFTWGMMLAAILLAAATTFNITYVAIWHSFNDRLVTLNAREDYYRKLSEIRAYLDAYYITDYDEARLLEGAAEGIVNALPDEWSYYMTAEDFAREMDDTADDYAGIGVSAFLDEEGGGLRIVDVYAESPAQKGGLRFFDLIVAVEGDNVLDLGFDGSIDRIRGEIGTEVALTVWRGDTGEMLELRITRGQITQQELQYELLEGQVGYIRISAFDERVDMQFQAAVEDLTAQGARALLFDLRFNPGGRRDVLINMLDYLLPAGVIMEWRDKKGNADRAYSGESFIDMPMAVLVHEYSFSAAEFFSAAMQEYGAATLVGMPTGGKGYSQNTFQLSDGSALILSTAEYFTPLGKNLQDVGITPDIQVEMSDEQLYSFTYLSPEEDPQLSAALEVLYGAIR